MDEEAIKAAALSRIRQQTKGRALPIVTTEFSLNGTGIRADIAVLDTSFYGIEIKSSNDTLKRLPAQMEGYARYFDRTELIVAPKHLRGLQQIDLHGAEVWRQEVLTDWQLHRPGQTRHISGHWLLQLLTAEDERRASRQVMRRCPIASWAEIDAVRRDEFKIAFKKRYGETSTAFWAAVRGRRITSNDLRLLSRFHADRQQQRVLERQADEHWANWISAMDAAVLAP